MPEVVWLHGFSRSEQDLHRQIDRLERRVAVLSAVVTLLLALVRACDLRERLPRMPSERAKQQLLRAIERARRALPLSAALRVLRIAPMRFHAWARAETLCQLDDRSSCPKTSPARTTVAELMLVKDMVLDPAYRHMPITTLARYAQRIGKLVLSPSSWARIVRKYGWTRPPHRVHPPKPRLGVRASAANALWHVDVTVLRLLDGSHVFVCAVIDNFSRMILAWDVAEKLSPLLACRVLADAARHLPPARIDTTLVSDSGSENVNAQVNQLLVARSIAHVVARVDVTYSNSMIEAFCWAPDSTCLPSSLQRVQLLESIAWR